MSDTDSSISDSGTPPRQNPESSLFCELTCDKVEVMRRMFQYLLQTAIEKITEGENDLLPGESDTRPKGGEILSALMPDEPPPEDVFIKDEDTRMWLLVDKETDQMHLISYQYQVPLENMDIKPERGSLSLRKDMLVQRMRVPQICEITFSKGEGDVGNVMRLLTEDQALAMESKWWPVADTAYMAKKKKIAFI